MKHQHFLLILIMALVIPFSLFGQQDSFDMRYPFKHSKSEVQDKNFYLLTLMEQLPEVSQLLKNDVNLKKEFHEQEDAMQQVINNCHDDIGCSVHPFFWDDQQMQQSSGIILKLLSAHPAALKELTDNMRRSGYFYRYQQLPDSSLFKHAWQDACDGINYILKAYSSNKGLLYPEIDSTTFDVNGIHYKVLVKETIQILDHQKDSMHLFFEPSLKLALALLFDNYRDEAARFEPLDSTNAAAYRLIRHTNWKAYPYSVILVPGEGPENNRNISIMGKYRCQLAAEQYRKGKAPFIVTSGGFVHPFQTPYCEANEMKKYLVNELGIPASAIIMEPHARHTTTNIRNTDRIIYRQGIPVDKPVLCTSTPSQIGYILSKSLKDRCQQLLQYVPYQNMKQLDEFNLEFYPVKESLQMDASDPLDP